MQEQADKQTRANQIKTKVETLTPSIGTIIWQRTVPLKVYNCWGQFESKGQNNLLALDHRQTKAPVKTYLSPSPWFSFWDENPFRSVSYDILSPVLYNKHTLLALRLGELSVEVPPFLVGSTLIHQECSSVVYTNSSFYGITFIASSNLRCLLTSMSRSS